MYVHICIVEESAKISDRRVDRRPIIIEGAEPLWLWSVMIGRRYLLGSGPTCRYAVSPCSLPARASSQSLLVRDRVNFVRTSHELRARTINKISLSFSIFSLVPVGFFRVSLLSPFFFPSHFFSLFSLLATPPPVKSYPCREERSTT